MLKQLVKTSIKLQGWSFLKCESISQLEAQSMSQLKNPTLEWLSAAVSVTEEDVWCNIFTSRKQQISIHNTAAVLHTVSVILSLVRVSVWPRCPHLHIVLTLVHVNISFTECQSSIQNHVSMLLSTQPQYIHRHYWQRYFIVFVRTQQIST